MDVEAVPLFRANKRRKVIRRKASTDDDQGRDLAAAVKSQSENTSQPDLSYDEPSIVSQNDNLARPRRPKKHGIAFNSSAPRPRDSNDEQSIVLAEPRVPELVQQSNERFVKPTGKAVVTDDKHMSAFIDSKLAELKSAGHSITNEQSHAGEHSPTSHHEPDEYATPGHGLGSRPLPSTGDALGNGNKPATISSANTSSKSTYSRPTRRRGPRARPEADVARDSMIDQIMQESQVPHYDRTTTHQVSRPSVQEGDEDVDNDAAAAAAFKADFLAAALEKNYHRRAPVNPTQGPKLGGSRSARERMKAMEDAQKEGAKTGKP